MEIDRERKLTEENKKKFEEKVREGEKRKIEFDTYTYTRFVLINTYVSGSRNSDLPRLEFRANPSRLLRTCPPLPSVFALSRRRYQLVRARLS